MVRGIHPTDSMLRTSAASRTLNAAEVHRHNETVECIRRARARVVYRNLPWHRRALLTVAAWLEIN